ncbi:MAG: serine hydrolase domain-containing protein [Coprococcus sp.]
MKQLKSLFGLLFFVACIFVGVICAEAKDENSIESCISEFQNKTKCNSISIVVYDNGRTSYYGNSKKDDLYQIGSMTKAFTGLGVMKLIHEGKITLDNKVSDYLPGFEIYYGGKKADILVSDLLSQTSGFTNSERDYPSAKENMTLFQWVNTISGKELKYRPGEQYSYSNVNYNLLGAVIEAVSGVSYKEYMEQEILIPLGLEQTFVGIPEGKKNIVDGTRLGYRKTYDFEIPVNEGTIPAGYFYSNTYDLCKWIEIWIGGADIPSEYKELVEETKNIIKQENDYYAGWESFENDVIGHSGGTANYSSRIVYSAEKNIGVCVLTNVNVAASTDRLCNDIFAIATGSEPCGFVYDVWSVFDIVFSGVTIIGIIMLFIIICCIKNIRVMIVGDVAGLVILTAIIVIIPIVFQDALSTILFVWAPWSVLGGIIVLLIDVIALDIKIRMRKKVKISLPA